MVVGKGAEKRAVGAALGIGIFILPFVFAWFTLRKGYTKEARAFALGWMLFVVSFFVIMVIAAQEAAQEAAAKAHSAEATASSEVSQPFSVAQPNADNQFDRTKFEKGDYAYKSDSDDDYVGCDEKPGLHCVGKAQWEQLCKNASLSQLFVDVFWGATYDSAVGYLVKNGGASEISLSWDDSGSKPSEMCKAKGTVSGMYQGSQVNQSVVRHVYKFKVNENDEVLAVDGMPEM